jgi:hypothetical protein
MTGTEIEHNIMIYSIGLTDGEGGGGREREKESMT